MVRVRHGRGQHLGAVLLLFGRRLPRRQHVLEGEIGVDCGDATVLPCVLHLLVAFLVAEFGLWPHQLLGSGQRGSCPCGLHECVQLAAGRLPKKVSAEGVVQHPGVGRPPRRRRLEGVRLAVVPVSAQVDANHGAGGDGHALVHARLHVVWGDEGGGGRVGRARRGEAVERLDPFGGCGGAGVVARGGRR